mmetsp:Transcript_62663/g.103353  ORF Transcript_62663/g.103353 Transcript_62663/m.103353 type:complete len:229 (+) Transcript_62663:3339-4025(+)
MFVEGVEIKVVGRRQIKILLTNVTSDNGHLIGRQSPCLVRTDGIRPTHCLTSSQHTNQAVVALHLSHGISQGDGHSQRQTFRDSNDHNCHSDDQEIQERLEVERMGSSTKDEVQFLDSQHTKSDSCGVQSKHTNRVCKVSELLLQWGLRLFDGQSCFQAALARRFSNTSHKDLTTTLGNHGSRQEEYVLVAPLVDGLGFSSLGRFITDNIFSINVDAIGPQNISVLDG